MCTRLLCFLALIAYVNTIFHQDGHVHGGGSCQIIDGTPLIEIVLEDVLEIPVGEEQKTQQQFQYDDYRPASSKWISIVPPTRAIDWNPLPVADILDFTALVPNTKISCLLGYYDFLFRLKPF